MQKGKDVVSTDANGLVTTRYTHECPHCGYIKTTVRASNKLPPAVRWTRELEKLLQRIWDDGHCFTYNGEPLVINHVEVKKHT